MTEGEFAGVMAVRMAIWPDAKNPPEGEGRRIWLRLLEGVSPGEATTAMEAMAREGQHFAPLAGEIVARAMALRSDEATWGEQWADFVCVMSRGSRGFRSDSTEIRDMSEQLLPMAGGLDYLAQTTEDDWPTLQAQTRDKWKALVARRLADERLAHIPGDSPRLAGARERVVGLEPLADTIKRLGWKIPERP